MCHIFSKRRKIILYIFMLLILKNKTQADSLFILPKPNSQTHFKIIHLLHFIRLQNATARTLLQIHSKKKMANENFFF